MSGVALPFKKKKKKEATLMSDTVITSHLLDFRQFLFYMADNIFPSQEFESLLFTSSLAFNIQLKSNSLQHTGLLYK